MKKIAGSLRLDLAAFRELEAFAQLGTELDTATQRQLDRGKRMVELLKQPQYQPYETFEQVVSIFAGTQGFLDDLPVTEVLRVRGRAAQAPARRVPRDPRRAAQDRRPARTTLAEEAARGAHELQDALQGQATAVAEAQTRA